MTRLVTERVTRAEAEQRRGRAGRVAPGWCYRLWTRGEEGALAAFPPPEIASADLAGLALELALWGAASPDGLAFLTPPPAAAFAEARALLADLGALDAAGRITAHGRAIAAPAAAPAPRPHADRERRGQGAGALAADLAALVEARDPLRGARRRPRAPPRRRCATAPAGPTPAPSPRSAPRRSRLRALAPAAPGPGLAPGAVLSLAYPDRIGQRRPGPAPRYLLSGGKGAALPLDDAARRRAAGSSPPTSTATRARRRSASRCRWPSRTCARCTPTASRREQVCEWSRRDRAVRRPRAPDARRPRARGPALARRPARARRRARSSTASATSASTRCPGRPAARRFAARVAWLRGQGRRRPARTSRRTGSSPTLDAWLAPWLAGMSRAADLARLDLLAALEARLDRADRQRLDRLAPAAITAPTGTTLPIDYSGAAPRVSVRLQEMFGLTRHPTVGAAAVPLVIELLSPAQRPVQTTADLPGFWASSYADVRRDLRGRYPRHPWPEDPAAAAPTRRARPPAPAPEAAPALHDSAVSRTRHPPAKRAAAPPAGGRASGRPGGGRPLPGLGARAGRRSRRPDLRPRLHHTTVQ